MPAERYVRLFRNGRNQALRIPREFEIAGNEAIIHKEGDRLIIEPVKKQKLRTLLTTWDTISDDFPTINDPAINPEDIF